MEISKSLLGILIQADFITMRKTKKIDRSSISSTDLARKTKLKKLKSEANKIKLMNATRLQREKGRTSENPSENEEKMNIDTNTKDVHSKSRSVRGKTEEGKYCYSF